MVSISPFTFRETCPEAYIHDFDQNVKKNYLRKKKRQRFFGPFPVRCTSCTDYTILSRPKPLYWRKVPPLLKPLQVNPLPRLPFRLLSFLLKRVTTPLFPVTCLLLPPSLPSGPPPLQPRGTPSRPHSANSLTLVFTYRPQYPRKSQAIFHTSHWGFLDPLPKPQKNFDLFTGPYHRV